MRAYKSPVQLKPSNMQKKSSINFVKNVAAPKQTKNQNLYNNQNAQLYQSSNFIKSNSYQPMDKYQPKQANNLILIINRPRIHSSSSKQIKSSIISQSNKPIRTIFPYNSNTQVKNLLSFIHSQLQDNMIYIKSLNIYIDYILGLKNFKIKQLVQLLKQQGNLQNQNHFPNQSQQLQVNCCEFQDVQSNNYLKNFQIIKCVGSGGFSKVFLVRAFGKLMAMKVINKDYILSNDKANIVNNQKTILSICSEHPFVTKLQTSFQTTNFLIFVMQFCNGGQLFNLLRKVRRMKQEDAKFYFVQTLSAIVYLHKKGIVYRDIKPENIIIDHEGHIRLADYGLSKIMQDNRQSKTYSFCGSAQYMAPQMLLKKGHSFQIDFYCLGALLYQLVVGLPPYYSRNQNELFSNIIHNELQFPSHVSLSNQLKNFLSNLLQKQVQNRYNSIQQILSDPWMQNINLEHVIQKRLKPPFKTDMFGYNFDDSDFAQQQKQMMQKLKQQKAIQRFDDIKFPDFFYESKQISDIKNVIIKVKQQGIFVRSGNNGIGQFIAQKYHQSRNISNSGSFVAMNKHSREQSITKLDHSGIISIPTSSQITRRIDSSHIFNEKSAQSSNIIYYPTTPTPKPHLSSVRSLQHINTSKSSLTHNRSQQRIGSITKQVRNQMPYTNIYTTHKQTFHPYGIKLTNPSPLISSQPIIRQPNYYSVQKSSSRGNGIRLDIHDLKIKNQRNYSVQRPRQNFSSNNLSIGGHNSSNSFLKHTLSAYELKRNYVQGFKDKNPLNKVKKSSIKNGQKISISMLNNIHYRN